MIIAIITILSVYAILLFAFWVTILVDEGIVKNDELLYNALVKNLEDGIYINSLNSNIITVGKMESFISTWGHEIFLSRYYINGIGQVPVWYKSHALIKEIYRMAKVQKLTAHEEYIRKKLGLD